MKNPILDKNEGEGLRITPSGAKYPIRLFKGGGWSGGGAKRQDEWRKRLEPRTRKDYYFFREGEGFAIPATLISVQVGFRLVRTKK